jgi:hypothetical protein
MNREAPPSALYSLPSREDGTRELRGIAKKPVFFPRCCCRILIVAPFPITRAGSDGRRNTRLEFTRGSLNPKVFLGR